MTGVSADQQRHIEHAAQQLATARRDVERALDGARRCARKYHAEGVSNADLADLLGVSRQAVTAWTRAKV